MFIGVSMARTRGALTHLPRYSAVKMAMQTYSMVLYILIFALSAGTHTGTRVCICTSACGPPL